MIRLRTAPTLLIGLASLAASAADPLAGTYSLRTPADVTASIPYTTVIEPGDGQNTVMLLQQPNQLPKHGSVSYPSIYTGAGQEFSYTPDPGYVGLDDFWYRVTDEDGGFSVGVISINVGNIPAVAGDDDLVVEADTTNFLDVLSLNSDTGFADPVTFSISQQPSHGILTFDVPVPLPGPLWQSQIVVLYTPDSGYTGSDQFQYDISDGIDQGTATVTLTVSLDTDGDGLLEVFDNCPATANPGQEDGDADGVGNACDNCAVTENPGQENGDADGVGNACDNCTMVTNASQCNSDTDGFGNRCDGDLNGNLVTNAQDYGIFRSRLGNTGTYDIADLNCNGSVNAQDYGIFRTLLGAPPGPSGVAP